MSLDSITFGYGSTDENGYRSYLVQELQNHTVDLIGDQRTGSMDDNNSEGRPGERINQTIPFSAAALAQKPNVIIVHVGSNDIVYDDDTTNAPIRLLAVVQRLFEDCPDAVVLLSQLGPSSNDFYQARMDAFNRMLPKVASHFASEGRHILVVDASQHIDPAVDLFDDIHPNDAGYKKMGQALAGALNFALAKGWVKDPINVPLPILPKLPRSTCFHNPNWIEHGRLATGDTQGYHPARKPLVLFGDLNNDGRADYLLLKHNVLEPYLNLGHPAPDDPEAPPITWLPLPSVPLPFALDPFAPAPTLARLDPQGPPMLLLPRRDAFVDGYALLVSPNPLAAPFTVAPYGPVAPALALDGAGVRFADLDGDGRPDYLYVHPDGAISAWLNRAHVVASPSSSSPPADDLRHAATKPFRLLAGSMQGARRALAQKALDSGLGPAAKLAPAMFVTPAWLPLGKVFAPPPTLAAEVLNGEIVLEDLDGDGRADVLLVMRDGAVRAWGNQGPGVDKNEDSPRFEAAPENRLRRRETKHGTGAASHLRPPENTTDFAVVVAEAAHDRLASVPVETSLLRSPPSTNPVALATSAEARVADLETTAALATADAHVFTSLPAPPAPITPPTPPLRPHNGTESHQKSQQEANPIPQQHPAADHVANWGWEDRGIAASGVGARAGVRTTFADLGGDGRAEYLIVTEGGAVWAWHNGCDSL